MKPSQISEEQRELIRAIHLDERSENQELSSTMINRRVIDRVKDEVGIIIDSNTLYEIVKRVSTMKKALGEMSEKVKSKKAYEVKDEDGKLSYVFHKKMGEEVFKFVIPVEEVDEMFHDFSKYGANLTEEQMLDKYQVKPEVWYMVKSRLRLYKTSNVISPYTAENTPEKELEEKVTKANIRHIDQMKAKMIRSHEKVKDAEAKRAMAIVANFEYQLDSIRTAIEAWTPRKVEFKPKAFKGTGAIQVAISDIHIGKRGTAAIKERFESILADILSRPEKTVNLLCLGDLVESVAPLGMHAGMERNMESHGFNLIMETVTLFEDFILKIYESGREVTFDGIGGNHDRFGERHDEDQDRTAALVIYEMIRRGLSKYKIRIDYYKDKINTLEFGDLIYILHHGDDGFDKKKMQETLWNHGSKKHYNVILHGDKHNVQVRNALQALMIGLPALAGKGEYDTRLDLWSDPGYVVVKQNAV